MFGLFKNRNKYNGTVDTKLNNEYQIRTRDNPLFPSVMAYLELIDNAWSGKRTEDEAALYIATQYYCGLIKNGHRENAQNTANRLASVASFGVQSGAISMDFSMKCLQAIEATRAGF